MAAFCESRHSLIFRQRSVLPILGDIWRKVTTKKVRTAHVTYCFYWVGLGAVSAMGFYILGDGLQLDCGYLGFVELQTLYASFF
jgi:hypothetical protein